MEVISTPTYRCKNICIIDPWSSITSVWVVKSSARHEKLDWIGLVNFILFLASNDPLNYAACLNYKQRHWADDVNDIAIIATSRAAQVSFILFFSLASIFKKTSIAVKGILS